jgi:hypothetical protein
MNIALASKTLHVVFKNIFSFISCGINHPATVKKKKGGYAEDLKLE